MSKTDGWKCKSANATKFLTHQAILIFVSLINEKYLFYRPFTVPRVPKGLHYCITDPLGNPAFILYRVFQKECYHFTLARLGAHGAQFLKFLREGFVLLWGIQFLCVLPWGGRTKFVLQFIEFIQ